MTREHGTKQNPVMFDDIPPNASAMVESMRAHGYTLATAIADLIDNSIAAECRKVWLQFKWEGVHSWVSVTDDGLGMSKDTLVNAMRLGSRSPLEQRSEFDLGRFGLGLKTASFSQARRLTVRSITKSGEDNLRRWDLDHLAKPETDGWQLLRSAHKETEDRIEELERLKLASGTQVLLEVLDRVVGKTGDKSSEDHFVNVVARVREHLEMVFHRFLADKGKSRLKIYLNMDPLKPWDPFVSENKAMRPVCDEPFPADELSKEFKDIRVKGFVLPHKDRFNESDPQKSNEAHRNAGGPAGWNAQQGFYLYRNRRLIVAGGWLGLGPGRNGWKQEEHYKLARIQVDITNSTDQEWQIDVKKSTANPPPALKHWLEGLAKTVRERAKKVYSHRAGYGPRAKKGTEVISHPWVAHRRSGDIFSYRIDQKNPVLKALIKSLPNREERKLKTLLRLIEETVPIQRIWIDTTENEDGVAKPFEGESTMNLRRHLKTTHTVLVEQGSDSKTAWEMIRTFPAFQTQETSAIIATLIDEEITE